MKDVIGNGNTLLAGLIGNLESLYLELAEDNATDPSLRRIAAAVKKGRLLRDALSSVDAYNQAIQA